MPTAEQAALPELMNEQQPTVDQRSLRYVIHAECSVSSV
jgi:hypothetical protein